MIHARNNVEFVDKKVVVSDLKCKILLPFSRIIDSIAMPSLDRLLVVE